MSTSTSGTTPNPGQAFHEGIPRYITYTSPVSTAPLNPWGTGAALPLNIVAHIVSYLDEPADLASVVRTCRLMYYMTLPSLYTNVSLHSYPDIRYVDGRPEGFGSGSPFLMALNGLATGSYANLVKELRLWGLWRELAMDDFAKGRVPETSMMLSIVVRAAIDRMAQIQTFIWDLDCKPLKTLYQGLAGHESLTSLTLKFPSTREPRPSVMIPPMANLRKFKAIQIDPLCYPDDISMLLFGSKKLEDLRLNFSPRMRQDAECSLNLDTYFGRCLRGNYEIPLKHFAVQNFYGPNTQGMDKVASLKTCKSITFLDMFGGPGGSHGGTRNVYLDATWSYIPKDLKCDLRSIRCNETTPQHVELLQHASGLINVYFINVRYPRTGLTPPDTSGMPSPPGNAQPTQETLALGRKYVHALTRHHGSTLKRMLLSDQWILSPTELGDLARYCPNLEQLAIATDSSNHNVIRLLVPFLPKLKAFRLLSNESLNEHLRSAPNEKRMEGLSVELYRTDMEALRWIAVGDYIYEAGESYTVSKSDGSIQGRRKITQVGLEAVKNIEIWKMDTLDIDVDPVAPFDP